MAENALWLLERAGPDARMVIWAHNFHVSTVDDWQGRFLREALGDDLVTVGFDFGHGSFTAGTILPNGFAPQQRHVMDRPPPESYEFRFEAAGLPRFLLDLRGDLSAPGASWLLGPHPLRAVGSGFAPANPEWFFTEIALPEAFDLVVYIDETTETRLLPARYPATWDPF